MTADCPDGFSYEAARMHTSQRARQHYWAVAIGLQRVDGLEVSPYVEELARDYVAGTKMTGSDLQQFCHTVASLWQVHPFAEGNTRTIAVFSELYLNYLGFNVMNEPFAEHSLFYRDALVRAIYRNAHAGILPDRRHLEAFYDNAVNDAGHTLDREALVCSELFDHPELLRNISPEKALVKRPQA